MNSQRNQFKSQPWRHTYQLNVVIGLLLMLLITVLTGCVVVQQPPFEPTVVAPPVSQPILAVNLDPAGDTAYDAAAVDGQGWPANSQVLLSLATPEDVAIADIEPVPVAVDAAGRFSQTILIPVGVGQTSGGLLKITARTTDGTAVAQAFFNLSRNPAATPIAAATQTATTTPVDATALPPDSPGGIARTGLNIRSGPGSGFAILGTLDAGDTAAITGVSGDRNWWQIRLPDAADERGWVATEFVDAQNVENVAVVTPPATPTATAIAFTGWRGEYFNNPDLNGAPALVRNDAAIDFDWGLGSPAAGINADNFSARWSRTVNFSEGTYRFYAHVDDGVGLWVDDRLVLDHWRDGSGTTHTVDVNLSSGPHTLRLEYNEQSSGALAYLDWLRLEGYPDWKGEYFDNPDLNGAPVLVRNDPDVRFSWGPAAPDPGVPADGFSARWSRRLDFDEGIYRFSILVDDGVRLWIDGNLLIDQWRSGDPRTFEAEIRLSDGPHDFRIDYFDLRFDAQIRLQWERVAGFSSWRAEYFANRNLNGDPALVRNESQIDYQWDTGAPAGGLPADDFSARWTQELSLEAGRYRFETRADDGVRVWLNDTTLIDDWHDGQTRDRATEVTIDAGKHTIRVEYYENSGNAQIKVSWRKI